jgi:hypothetical protein
MIRAGWFERRVAAAGCVALLQVAPAMCADQVLQLADDKSFYESYLDTPPVTRGRVVGATIVGLRLQGATTAFRPGDLRIALGRGTRPEILCLRVLSRDGRYFARAQYRTAGISDDEPRVDFRSSYQDKLAAYGSGDIAVSVVGADKACDERKAGQFLAATLERTDAPEGLVIQVRAGDARIRAQLGRNNAAIGAAVLCDKRAGPAIGFTHECAIALPKPLSPGVYQLSLGETAASGEIAVKTHTLLLAPAAANP